MHCFINVFACITCNWMGPGESTNKVRNRIYCVGKEPALIQDLEDPEDHEHLIPISDDEDLFKCVGWPSSSILVFPPTDISLDKMDFRAGRTSISSSHLCRKRLCKAWRRRTSTSTDRIKNPKASFSANGSISAKLCKSSSGCIYWEIDMWDKLIWALSWKKQGVMNAIRKKLYFIMRTVYNKP